MLDSEQVIAAIHGSYAMGSKNGFENVRGLLKRMGASMPEERKVPIIHVAGTNGKGSTCAMLESVLRHAGYHTGLYTSPFLQAYPERIRLDGLPMTEAQLVHYGNPLVEAAEALRREEQGCPTPFEMGTALALATFEGEKCDVAVVEVGMGGRKDPTNIVRPILCAITAIGLDHQAYLGDTLAQIAAEKAGIIKPGVPVVCHPAEKEVQAVFAAAAESCHAPLRQLDASAIRCAEYHAHGATVSYALHNEWPDVQLSLPGEHQAENAMSVLAMVEELRAQGWEISDQAVYDGLRQTVWPARLEWCDRCDRNDRNDRCAQVLLDGAHNPQGVKALRTFVSRHLTDRRCVLLTGVLSDKLQPAMLRDFAAMAHQAVTVTPDSPRALDAREYAEALRQCGMDAQAAETLEEGLHLARTLAGEDGVVIAAGSLYFAGSLRTALGLPWR